MFSVLLGAVTMVLGAAACDKNTAAKPSEAKEVVTAIDNAGKPEHGAHAGHQHGGGQKPQAAAQVPTGPINRDPIPGVDLTGLSSEKTDRFYRMVDTSLQSPCGKPHSLRKSLVEDATCKRAPFAAKYVISMLADEASDEDIKQFYDDRYRKDSPARTFNLGESVPHSGPVDAPVKLVEFFDYGCPACKHFAPVLKEALSSYPNEVVLFYKQFPLPGHPDSGPAAQAALAANAQGKYVEMHELLFLRAPRHKVSDLKEYAKSLGLDMGKFERDFQAAVPLVRADMAEGDLVKVQGTPTLFVNGREYSGPLHPTYLKLWIEEELAVNR